jgi:hypothetical protein
VEEDWIRIEDYFFSVQDSIFLSTTIDRVLVKTQTPFAVLPKSHFPKKKYFYSLKEFFSEKALCHANARFLPSFKFLVGCSTAQMCKEQSRQ